MGLTTASEVANRLIGGASKSVNESSNKIAAGKAFTSASQDAAGSSIAMKLTADQAGLRQASKNASQGAALIQTADKAYEKSLQELVRMRELATQVNNGALQSDERAQADAEFQQRLTQLDNVANRTRFGDLALLNGGGGALSLHGAVTGAVSGAVASPANTFHDAALLTASSGFFTGSVSDIKVTDATTAGSYEVSLKIGDQTFTGISDPVATATLTLTSTSNASSSVQLEYHATDVTGLSSAATFETALTQTLSNASFVSTSIAPTNGVPTAATSFTTTSSTQAGKYALSYNAAASTFTLSDSTGKTYEETATTSAAQTITFGNGLSFTTSGFTSTTDIAQMTFDVAKGTNVSLTFQTNVQATDTSVATFVSATTSDLGLSGASIAEVAGATTALANIEAAINSLNIARATVGALQAGFESTVALNEVQAENLGVIKGSFEDLDYASEQTALQESNVKMQAAISMSAMSNQNMQLMLKLLN